MKQFLKRSHTCDYNAILWSSSWWSTASTTTRTSTSSTKASAATSRKFDPKFVPVIIVPIASVDCVICVSRVFKFNKSKRWPSTIFQVNKSDFSVFIKQVFNVFCSDIWRQIANVNSAFVGGHDFSICERSKFYLFCLLFVLFVVA